jgi:hypothetical protein
MSVVDDERRRINAELDCFDKELARIQKDGAPKGFHLVVPKPKFKEALDLRGKMKDEWKQPGSNCTLRTYLANGIRDGLIGTTEQTFSATSPEITWVEIKSSLG